jgi:integrase
VTTHRKVIARFGPHGGRVTVWEDVRRRLISVTWYVRRLERRTSWPATPTNREAALDWAQDFARTRDAAPQALPVTLRALWTAYQQAEFPTLRPRTRALYTYRWTYWELFLGRETVAESVRVPDVARFRDAMTQAGRVINQVGEAVKVAKLVHQWGYQVGLLAENRLAGYRFKIPKDAVRHEPGEYRTWEFDALLHQLDPTQAHQWRAWVALMLLGHQGMRERSVLHLRWEDVRGDRVLWPAKFQKSGRAFGQPLRWGALAALETARWWREQLNLTSPFILPGRKPDQPYGVQALWHQLRQAERKAGIPHAPYRATHGFRRMVVGEIVAATGNLITALQFIGDRDLGQAQHYAKTRYDVLAQVAHVLDTEIPTSPRHDGAGRISGVDANC